MLNKIFTLVYISIVSILLVNGCSSNDPEGYLNISGIPDSQKGVLAVELEHHFDNDPVWIILNDNFLMHDFITTDYTISAAWLSGPFEYFTGDHRLYVGFNDNSVIAEHNFILTDTLTIRITYNVENKKFSFFEMDGLFLGRD